MKTYQSVRCTHVVRVVLDAAQGLKLLVRANHQTALRRKSAKTSQSVANMTAVLRLAYEKVTRGAQKTCT